ncbi:MAG: molybdopterin-binding/glycosyltransferase family 2 protein [Gammaproteobacteria bacterium]|nr:molybdopterin-binding/glycosyltransferase family 2 protein [Gammaproteobacteria bacterium]
MRFGRIPIAEAAGAILAHTTRHGDTVVKKGRVLTSGDIATLRAAGCEHVVAARLEHGEIGEDEAAARVAQPLCGSGVLAHAPYTGRNNLYARGDGLLVYERERLDAINLVDEAVTVAALPPFAVVGARQLVATVKIIPYGVAAATADAVAALAAAPAPLFELAQFRPRRAGLVQTRFESTRESVLDKTRATLEQRIARGGGGIVAEVRCAHDELAVAAALRTLREAGCDLYLVTGASATNDRRDVIPAALVATGGAIVHLGMPVEPGNLLLLGRSADERPVVGLPGCARSPALNGFDWVLERLLADLPVTRESIMRMGAGGYIKGQRTAPRAREDEDGTAADRAPHIAALVLAAGHSRRMGTTNKLLVPVDGEPMVRRVLRTLGAACVDSITVVTGHDGERVRACVAGEGVTVVHNPDHAEGLSSSLRRGLAALPADADGVLVCLGDMPWVSVADVRALIAAFAPQAGRGVCVPVHGDRRGNPVLWERRYFPELDALRGDSGARSLLQRHAEAICEVPVPDDGVLRDVDTPAALTAAG